MGLELRAVRLADINGDGRVDIVVVTSLKSDDNYVYVFASDP